MSEPRLRRLWRVLPLFGLALLNGCSMTVLNPKGIIGVQEKSLIITATLLMLVVVIPVIVLTLVFAFRYRSTNTSAKYLPDWCHSNKIEAVVWAVPCVIILILGTITWETTHSLDPYKPLAVEGKKPLDIDVVALDWKWLFIYPEQHIATVNQIAFPVDRPVHFRITSATVMNSFFIPQLGSQIYAMAGMATQLNLIANQVGTYDGISANYSGAGFSQMKFTAEATTEQGFNDWVESVRGAHEQLKPDTYYQLATPSEGNAVQYFAGVMPNLFTRIVAGNMGPGMHVKGVVTMPETGRPETGRPEASNLQQPRTRLSHQLASAQTVSHVTTEE